MRVSSTRIAAAVAGAGDAVAVAVAVAGAGDAVGGVSEAGGVLGPPPHPTSSNATVNGPPTRAGVRVTPARDA